MSKYTRQFKLSVIQAYLKRGSGFRSIAARFNMDPALLRRWVHAYRLHGDASLQVRGKDHSPDFKVSVLERMWRDRLSLRQTAAIFNLSSSTQIATWESRYYSGGIKALATGKKGPYTVMRKPPAKPVEALPVNDEDLSHAQLLEKLRWAQMEIAYLKKLKELREEKARQKEAEKKKPG